MAKKKKRRGGSRRRAKGGEFRTLKNKGTLGAYGFGYGKLKTTTMGQSMMARIPDQPMGVEGVPKDVWAGVALHFANKYLFNHNKHVDKLAAVAIAHGGVVAGESGALLGDGGSVEGDLVLDAD